MMSIADLEKKLALMLARHTTVDGLISTFPPPHRLSRRLALIEERFDALENNQPAIEKVRLAIEKLERDGRMMLTQRDWKNVAWGLCATLPNRSQKLLFKQIGREVLQAFQDKQVDLTAGVYRALLSSYFAVTSGELQKDSSQWLVLRDLLDRSRLTLQQQSKRPKAWMQPLNDYPELLRTQPTKRLAVDFVHDPDDQKIVQLTETLNITENSWFWEALIQQAVKSICELDDAKFAPKIDRLLHLMTKRPTYTQLILSSILDRYAQSTQRDQAHEQLKELALKQWGSPQYGSSAGWSNVKPDTKQMVIQWFVQADLEAFFNLFNEDADERRFHYWMRFIRKISFSQIIFGETAINSTQQAQVEFKKRNSGRFKQLVNSPSKSNNGFVIKIGGFFIVELSQTNNATYLYRQLPYDMARQRIPLGEIKDRGLCDKYLSHVGDWESNFDRHLAKRGIFPDQSSTKPRSSAEYGRM
jgi:hypothetical protein